jgi:nicotinate-nucleotide adenylyltransferase
MPGSVHGASVRDASDDRRNAFRKSINGRGQRIAIFGGTFDPIHLGHLAVARAAQRRFHLDCIFFVPAGCPPHKTGIALSPFVHRFAMTSLACADHPRFVPSLAEAGPDGQRRRVCYSVDTVRWFKKQYSDPGNHLYFLLGADSFLQFDTWKDYEVLLGLCDFVVASRPGFSSDTLRSVIPPNLFAAQPKNGTHRQRGAIALRHTTVYALDTVESHVSATLVRERLDSGQSVRGLVPSSVEEYIIKQALYK